METPKQQKQQQQSPQIYTTVGSIYNPHATPLQPPARRGRTVKWPPNSDYIHKSALAGFSLKGSMSPPTTANSLQQYSPLQQNQDRAVSPGTTSPESFYNSAMLAGNSFTAAPAASDKHGDAKVDDNDDVEVDENLRNMSVKTLTNLASYPNPMQKNAQMVLSRARPLANISNASMPNLRNTRSDPATLANLLQSDGVSEYEAQSSRNAFKAVLSKGYGAPQPLTAGPPGLRQHKSSTLDTDRQRSRVYDDAALAKLTASNLNYQQYQYQYPYALARQSTPSFKSEGFTSVQAHLAREASLNESTKISDTLTAEQVRPFYPFGIPHDFSSRTKPLPPGWAEDYPLDIFGMPKNRGQAARQAKIDAYFYAGNDMINTSMDDAIREKSRRDFERTIGVIGDKREKSKDKVVNKQLTIEEANKVPASEHAEALLNMTFQTLINHPQSSTGSTLPKFEYKKD
ncbi:uncharacterized protein BCR38DRAFT_407651 [Pseudomassariella vexata]|uniref:Uncharacterized protein n=1 Tax=Pseudomassariella vexata TaxID=1141098 RepID=A0A1Y2E810_9PEZI|nr:uncharacterized protein BCR38DRAFT_407651 [Pseudomassariella vexata]ORY67701.1 hypothetical protein BCR38DRAFT_407651 [Pseudomassariella vexata]